LSHYSVRSGDVVRGEADYQGGPHRDLATPYVARISIAGGFDKGGKILHKMWVAEIGTKLLHAVRLHNHKENKENNAMSHFFSI
jgi:hypothetical protein